MSLFRTKTNFFFTFCLCGVHLFGTPLLGQTPGNDAIQAAKKMAAAALVPPSLQQTALGSTPLLLPNSIRSTAKNILYRAVSGQKNNPNLRSPIETIRPFSDPVPGCADTSRKQLYWQQGRAIYVYQAVRAKDGGILVVGITIDADTSINQWDVFPFLMKLTASGQVVWNRQLRGNARNDMDLQELYEMQDGSVIATGDMNNPENLNVQGHMPDALVVKISPDGRLVWSRTFYRTKYHCSQFTGIWLKYFHELPGGDLLLGGIAYNCPMPHVPVIMRLSPTGQLIWSKAIGNGDYGNTNVTLFMCHMAVKNNTISLILWDAHNLFKVETPLGPATDLKVKAIRYVNQDYTDPWNYLLSNDMEVTELPNGNMRILSKTLGSFAASMLDTISLGGILDLSPDFEPLSYLLPSTTIKTNYNNQFNNLEKDGSLDIGFLEVFSGYSGVYYMTNFGPKGQTLKQRKIVYNGVGMPTKPLFIRSNSGGQNFLQTHYDSASASFFLENTTLHLSDTASACLGYDTSFIFWQTRSYIPFVPQEKWPVYDTTIFETPHSVWEDTLLRTTLFDGCNQVSYCDSLSIIPPATTVCRPGQVVTLDAATNKACGAWVQWYAKPVANIAVQPSGQRQAGISFSGNFDGWVFAEIAGNCRLLKDSVRFTVAQLPAPLTLGPDSVICSGNSISLKATKGYSFYQWNTGNTGDSLLVNNPGTFWVSARDACGQTVSDTIRLLPFSPPFFSGGDAQAICPGQSVRLQATPGFLNYRWDTDSTLDNAAIASPLARPLTSTVYRVQAEARPGCFVGDSVTITVFRGSPFSLGADFRLCSGEQKLLQGPTGFASYRWNTSDTAANLLVNKPGTYILETISFDGCPQSDTVILISLHPLPVVALSKDSVLCAGSSLIYVPGVYPSFKWNNGTQQPTLTVSQPGMYWVRVTDANSCEGGDTAVITRLQPLPASFLPADSTICNYDTWQLRAIHPFASYRWNNGITTESIQVNGAGNYRLLVTDNYGCKGEDEINVQVKPCLEGLFPPDAFTPNNDGINDAYRVLLFGNIISYNLRIFNRFGEQVFHTKDNTTGWPGTLKGKPQPAGTYIWKCSYQLQGADAKEQKGSFMLIR